MHPCHMRHMTCPPQKDHISWKKMIQPSIPLGKKYSTIHPLGKNIQPSICLTRGVWLVLLKGIIFLWKTIIQPSIPLEKHSTIHPLRNKLAKARKTRTSPGTLDLKKFGLGKLWVKKVFGKYTFTKYTFGKYFSPGATRDADRLELRKCDQQTDGQTNMGRC